MKMKAGIKPMPKKENSLSNIDFTQNKTVKVYLPAGSDWFDFWTNEKYKGGQEIEKSVNLQSIPLYVKAGSIIPFGPDVQYATEKNGIILHKNLSGTDADFVLYEDEFDNYNYEKGDYTEIPFHWNEKSKTLTIDSRKGNFKGMIDKRNFNLILPDGQQKSVSYSGKKVNVNFK
jgi:alpha-D-xyloside xylohydrolase